MPNSKESSVTLDGKDMVISNHPFTSRVDDGAHHVRFVDNVILKKQLLLSLLGMKATDINQIFQTEELPELQKAVAKFMGQLYGS